MYPLQPECVYMLQDLHDDEHGIRRMQRMLDAIDFPPEDVVTFAPDDLPTVFEHIAEAWSPDAVTSETNGSYRRPMIMTQLKLGQQAPDFKAVAEKCPDGFGTSAIRDAVGYIDPVRKQHERESDWERGYVCWPTNDFGVMSGCPHGCQYCGAGKNGRFIAVGLNLEEYTEQIIGPTIEANEWQKCFRMIGWGADIITFEPEYGCFDLFTRKLADYDRFGYFHTASDNVEWIRDLEYRDRIIGVWSITCDGVSRHIEPGSGDAKDRIDAVRKVQNMGRPVRLKLKPMIPIKGWRQQYADILKYALERTEPESIGFCVIMWMDFDVLQSKFDLTMLDDEFVDAARDAADDLAGVHTGPFPHEVRAEIYRFLIDEVRAINSDVPLYISTESRQMWKELADDLGQSPDSYVCGCSSVALPGGALALSEDCPHSTFKRLQKDQAT